MSFWELLKEQNNYTVTENGAVALKSTGSACLDIFATFGQYSFKDVYQKFSLALNEDKQTAMRLLFYTRNPRGGMGRRDNFRKVLIGLANSKNKDLVVNNLSNILEFGRGDDLLCLLDTEVKNDVVAFIAKQLELDMSNLEKCSLLAKWLPSANSSSKESRRLAKIIISHLGWTEKKYRKTLSSLRKNIGIVESKMSAQQWTDINYNIVPSKAALLYTNAFYRHDEEGYGKYLEELVEGKGKVNATVTFPVDIVGKVIDIPYWCEGKVTKANVTKANKVLYNAAWNALPNYFEGHEENSICVVDVSGSMTCDNATPLKVAISLGLYCAERNKGVFNNKFITFSGEPELVEIHGEDLYEKVNYICGANCGFNTNLEKVFELILNTAVKNNVPQEELPKKLYIISDMQFDEAIESACAKETLMDTIRKKYEKAGYELPSIVYWNVSTYSKGIFQQDFQGENCCMVSGYSPSLFEAVIKGTTIEVDEETGETREKLDPMTVMVTALYDERYDVIYWGDK